MISLLVSIIALGIIITIHEFGHFLAARAMGIGVIEFSIGMGPRICSKVIGNVRYSLRIMPFGGSCMMLGEELDESEYLEDEDDCGEADRECGSSDDAGNEALSESESYTMEEAASRQRSLITAVLTALNAVRTRTVLLLTEDAIQRTRSL